MAEMKGCNNCKHQDLPVTSITCKSCTRVRRYDGTISDPNHWEPIEKKVIEKKVLKNMDISSLYPTFQSPPDNVEESLEQMCELWRKSNMSTRHEGTITGRMFIDEMHHIYRAGVFEGLKAPEIKDVIFNNPATIVFWKDGTKTVVKCQNKEKFDPEKGLAMAFVKKIHGNKGKYFDQIKDWVEPYEEQQKLLKKKNRNRR